MRYHNRYGTILLSFLLIITACHSEAPKKTQLPIGSQSPVDDITLLMQAMTGSFDSYRFDGTTELTKPLSDDKKDSDPAPVPLNYKAPWEYEVLEAGLTHYYHHFDSLFQAPQYINILAFDSRYSDRNIEIIAGSDIGKNAAPISVFGEEAKALAAINAGFGHGGPDSFNSGILKIRGNYYPYFDGEPDSLHFVGSSAMGVDSDGNLLFRLRNGDYWENWPEAVYALAGGHALIVDGTLHETILHENYYSRIEQRHAGRRHPRTAVCTDPNAVILLITIDGRHMEAVGLTLRELGSFMLELGCKNGINLDGGGSTTMWIQNKGVVNHPSGNQAFDPEGERPRKTAVLIR